MNRDDYEWKAMSEWLEENPPVTLPPGKKQRTPADDGWQFVGGALKRPKKRENNLPKRSGNLPKRDNNRPKPDNNRPKPDNNRPL